MPTKLGGAKAHFNGFASLPPRKVIDAIKEHVELEAEIHGGCSSEQRAVAQVDRTIRAAADLLHAAPEETYLARDPIQSLRTIVRSLRLAPHQTVLQFGLRSFPSGCTDAEVRTVPAREDGSIDLEALAVMADENDTALLAMNHCGFSGAITPVCAVAAIARASGALLLLEASETIGQTEIDVAAAAIDLLVSKGSGYLRGPRGTSVACIRACPEVDLATIRADESLIALGSAYLTTTDSFGSHVGLGTAIAYHQSLGPELLRARSTALADRLHAGLRGILEMVVVEPADDAPGCRAVVCFRHAVVSKTRELHALLTWSGMTIECIKVPGLDGSVEPRDPVSHLRVALQYYNTEEEVGWLIASIRAAVEDMRDEHDWITLDLSDAESDKSGWGRMGSLDSSFSSVSLDTGPVTDKDESHKCSSAVSAEEKEIEEEEGERQLFDEAPAVPREPVASAADLSLGGPAGNSSAGAGPSLLLSAMLIPPSPPCGNSSKSPELDPRPTPSLATCNLEGLMAALSHDRTVAAMPEAVQLGGASTRSARSERSFDSVGFGSASDADDEIDENSRPASRPASSGSEFSDMGLNAAIEYDSMVEEFDCEFDCNRTSYQNPLFKGPNLTDDEFDGDGDDDGGGRVAGSSGESTVASSPALSASSPLTIPSGSFTTGSMCRHGSTSMTFASSRGLHEVLEDTSDTKPSRAVGMSSPGFIIGSPKPHTTVRSISPMLRAAAISATYRKDESPAPLWKPHPYSRIPVSQDMPIPNFSPYSPFSPVIGNSRQRPLPFAPQAPPVPPPSSRLTMEDLRSSTPPPMSSHRYGGLAMVTKGQFGSASSLDSGIGIAQSL